MIQHPSPNFNDRLSGTEIDMLVLHYTGMKSAEHALQHMCDPDAQVSAHYCIDENGSVYQLVEEQNRAWHAGVSSWRGNNNINDRSIGIELVNPGREFGYRPFPEVQMKALIDLSGEIVARRSIPQRNVVGHSDIAPTRKQDPGELFDWAQLAKQGTGLWPSTDFQTIEAPNQLNDFRDALAHYGYDISDFPSATLAFQRHFRPSKCNGKADTETNGILNFLISLL